MQKLTRLSLALAVAGAISLTKAWAAPSVSSGGFTVVSGTVKATVGGETKTYKKGDVIPEQAEVTATSDAQVTDASGMTISVKSGTTYQAAHDSNGLVDVKATGGRAVTVSGYGETYTVPVGSEASMNGNMINLQVISGHVGAYGQTGSGDFAAGIASSILVSQTTPTQLKTVVSPSAP